VVGTNVSPSYPPLEFVDESSGTVQGFDIDLARAIGERLNAAIRIETTYSFETLPAAIADRHVDLIISGIPIQREQTQGVVYSVPYLAIGQGVAVRRDLQIPITRVEDLSQLGLIGVQQNTVGEDALRNAGIASAQMYYVAGIDEAFVELARGTIDAVVADGAAVAWYTRQWAETIKLVGGPFAVNEYGIVMRPDDQRLRTAINGTLQDLKDDGTLQQLLNTWGLEHVAYIP
jgi:ABC-type amino acid transport substrate-binding protein